MSRHHGAGGTGQHVRKTCGARCFAPSCVKRLSSNVVVNNQLFLVEVGPRKDEKPQNAVLSCCQHHRPEAGALNLLQELRTVSDDGGHMEEEKGDRQFLGEDRSSEEMGVAIITLDVSVAAYVR